MSYASMSYADIATPDFPAFGSRIDPRTILAARRAVRRAGRIAVVAAQSAVLAASLWLILAGPGFLSDRSAASAPSIVMARR